MARCLYLWRARVAKDSYVYLSDIEQGHVCIERVPDSETIQLQMTSPRKGNQLCNLSQSEAHKVYTALSIALTERGQDD